MQGIKGGILGALIGSVGEDANGSSRWAAGTMVGGGAFMGLTALVLSSKLSPSSKVVSGAFAGAAIGAGLGMFADGKIIKGSPQDLATKSEVGTQAAIGAGAGVLIGLVQSAAFRQDRLRLFPRTRVSMLQRGNNVGVLVRW